MEGNVQVIRRDDRVKCLKRDPDDKEFEGVVTYVHPDKQHVDIRFGPWGVLSRSYVPIKFIEAL